MLAPLACNNDTGDDEIGDETGTGEAESSDSSDADSSDSSDSSDSTDSSSDDSTDSSTDDSTDSSDSSSDDSTDSTTDDATETDDTTETGDGDLSLTSLEVLGTYTTGVFDEGAAEIVDYHAASQRLFVVNGADEAIDVLDLADPSNPTLVDQLAVAEWGESPNSLAVHGDWLAVAIEAINKQAPGVVLILDADTLDYVNHLTVGALPDMLTFSPDGSKLLVACEGEPSQDYLVDPEGSIAIIDLSGDVAALTDADVQLAEFSAFTLANLDPQVRVFGPGSSVAEDLEPEYIAVSPDSTQAWVTLQENNAIAIIDLATATVTNVVALGFKNHSQAGKGLDPSDDDGAAAIANWPVFGMYQPDGIASFEVAGQTFLISANEGDARDYDGFGEEVRVKNLTLDNAVFPNASELQADELLGRLNVTESLGDIDNDGEWERLYAFGSRSVAIWTANGSLVWDSGELLEQVTADALPEFFNSDHTANELDNRSDNKGPEPEGVTVAELWGKPYAFVGLERISGVVVLDLSDPQAPAFVLYDNSTRDFAGDPELGTAGDLGPEGLHVILADQSPIGEPLLVVANEVSGSTTVYRIVGE